MIVNVENCVALLAFFYEHIIPIRYLLIELSFCLCVFFVVVCLFVSSSIIVCFCFDPLFLCTWSLRSTKFERAFTPLS